MFSIFLRRVSRSREVTRHLAVTQLQSTVKEPRSRDVDTLILAYTGMPTTQNRIDWLTNPSCRTSSHYVVGDAGDVYQLVAEGEQALHAGTGFCWKGDRKLNNRSIFVELANPGHEYGYNEYPTAQITALTELCRGILVRNPMINPTRVLAASDALPMRRPDPGAKFPWAQLAEHGIGIAAPKDVPLLENACTLKQGDTRAEVKHLQDQLLNFGYEIRGGQWGKVEYDAVTTAVVCAFQLHFRPRLADGVADSETQSLLAYMLNTTHRIYPI